ncbi:ABC transporter permease [Paenibacillus sp. y28]|uniref:ABC transporter permease n=1 Tax=Paenibacillus sp. y28 TaxID=3129110 RepID=UPI0030186BA8
MRKHIRLVREFLRACLVEEFEYRANFAANILTTLFWLGAAVLTVNIYFYQADALGGWSYYEVLALLGMFNLIQGLIEFFLQPNMKRLVEHIRKGTLDFVLMKPVDSQFYVSFRHLVFWRLFDVAAGFALLGYALWRAGIRPDAADAIVFVVMLLAAIIVVYSLWMGMMTFSFWAVKVDNLSYLFHSVFETARFPVSVYGGFVRFVLTYLFPIALVTTVPTEALLGRLGLAEGMAAAGIALVFLGLARWFWRFALRHYTSASS